MADSLQKNTSLRELNIEYNEIGDIGIKQLSGALLTNRSLMLLKVGKNIAIQKEESDMTNIGKNDFEYEGAVSLAVALGKNSSLLSLSIGIHGERIK